MVRVLAAVLLAFSVALAGYFVGEGFRLGRQAERAVTVKGLAEREAKADLALWPLRFVAAGDDLPETQARIERDGEAVRGFLVRQGVKTEEIAVAGVEVTDMQARAYGEGRAENRFIVAQTLTVRSADVDRIERAAQAVGELVNAGVALSAEGGPERAGPVYLFTQLNALKPAMIAEATRSARAAAEQFAADSGARLGGIRRAHQGVFEINPRDDYPGAFEPRQMLKTVRVVTTVEWLLAD
jgi:uncharacterized protein